MLYRTLDDGLQVHRIRTEAEAEALRDRFVAAYREVFALPPYSEDHTEDEASAIWDKLVGSSESVVLVVMDGEELAAFGAAIPLAADPAVARELIGLVPPRFTMYMAELGVREPWADRRLARWLVNQRLKLIDAEGYSHVVLRRLQHGKTEAVEFYRSRDFTDMGVSMTVTVRDVDGTMRDDERLFMSRVLSQVDVEE